MSNLPRCLTFLVPVRGAVVPQRVPTGFSGAPQSETYCIGAQARTGVGTCASTQHSLVFTGVTAWTRQRAVCRQQTPVLCTNVARQAGSYSVTVLAWTCSRVGALTSNGTCGLPLSLSCPQGICGLLGKTMRLVLYILLDLFIVRPSCLLDWTPDKS